MRVFNIPLGKALNKPLAPIGTLERVDSPGIHFKNPEG